MKIKFLFIILFAFCVSSFAETFKCSSTEEIIYALHNVKAGDKIIVASGSYTQNKITNKAYYFSSASGTKAAPIIFKSTTAENKAKLKGKSMNAGAVLRITGNHWLIENLDFSVGLKGVVFDNTLHNTISNSTIHTIGNEALHVRDGASFTLINNCKIFNTGNINPGYGEGIYIGTDKHDWKKYNPNCTNNTIKNSTIGPNVRAEAIDIKEGTQNTLIENNEFNAIGISGVNSSNSFISIKGVKNTIKKCTFYANGNVNIKNGITAVNRQTKLSGFENFIHNNVFYMNDSQNKIVQANKSTKNIYAWNNTRIPKGKKYNKTVINTPPVSENILYEDNFNKSKLRFLGSALKNIDVSIPNKGEVKLQMKQGAILPPYSPIMYRFPRAIDFTNNPKIVIRVKASKGFKLRFDLHDGVKATNGSNGRVSKIIPSGLDNWTDLEFVYSNQAFLDNNVDKTSIKRINIQLDSGKENFPGELFIDFIKIIDNPVDETIKNTIVKPNNSTIQNSSENKKYVILKMDDLRANTKLTYNSNWQKFVNVIRNYKINAGLGIVAEDLPKASDAYKDSLRGWHKSKYFEIWHHGWDHKRKNYPPNNSNLGEFSGTPYKYQKEHFEKSMLFANSQLGIVMRTFGAPFNQTDEIFSKIIRENKYIKVWLYPKDKMPYNGLKLYRGSSNLLESKTGVVSYKSFLKAYENSKTEYLVLQGHPGKWNSNSFKEFDKVIQFLKKENVVFVLPYQYYQIKNK